MKKIVSIFVIPFLFACSSIYQVKAEESKDFICSELTITDSNYNALQFNKTSRGLKIEKATNMTSTDAYLRFDQINNIHEEGVKTNKYLAIRYRSNYDPKFALRIKSTTGASAWNDFLFSHSKAGHITNSVGTWNTYVYNLSFENASNISQSTYNDWEEGNYVGVSFNIVNPDSFALNDSYLYLSSFAFFASEEEANSYSGLSYAQNPDTKGPEITIPYGDGTTFNITAGKFVEFSASAYDAYDDISQEVKGELSSGALDANGKFVKGNHTVTFKATDLSGNESTKILNLIVGDKDNVSPVINCDMSTIYVQTGTYNCLVFFAHDAIDGDIKCEYVYSTGSIDSNNKFVKGNHTLTLKATDLTGNEATKTITIIVSDDFNPNNLEVITETK